MPCNVNARILEAWTAPQAAALAGLPHHLAMSGRSTFTDYLSTSDIHASGIRR